MDKLIIDIHYQQKHIIYEGNYAWINVHTWYMSSHYVMKPWSELGLMLNSFNFCKQFVGAGSALNWMGLRDPAKSWGTS